jgi:hypothetical protein
MLLQHPFLHWEFEEHSSQSPSDPSVGGGVVGPVMWGLFVLGALVVGLDVVGEDVGADIAMVNQFMFQPSPATLIYAQLRRAPNDLPLREIPVSFP